VASQDIGNLGPKESEPTRITCHWMSGMARLLPWVLVGLLLIWQARRDRRALAVLIPLIAIYLIWSIARQMLPFDSIAVNMLAQGISDVSAALAVLWLVLTHLTCDRRKATFLLSLMVMMAVAAIGPLGELSAAEDYETITRLLSAGVGALAISGSLMLAGLCSRKAGLGARFVTWWLVWLLLLTVASVVAVAATVILIEDHSLEWFFIRIYDTLLVGLVVSAAACLVSLPFVILALESLSHRLRLESYLGVPLRQDTPTSGSTS